jgi:4-carboxymuconolactone decarboxylase
MSSEPRIPLASPESLEPIFGHLNVTRAIGQNPGLLAAWGGFATYILGPDLSLSPRERELAILRVGWNLQADYEWGHHVEIAHRIGMTVEDIQAVQEGPGSAHLGALDRLILHAVDELRADAEISADTWAGLKAFYSDRQMLDLLFTIGQYTMVCSALKSIKVPLEEGYEGLPARS